MLKLHVKKIAKNVSVKYGDHEWYLVSARRLPSEAPSPAPCCTIDRPFASIRLVLRLAKYLEIHYI